MVYENIKDAFKESIKKGKAFGSFWTRTKYFQDLCNWAFKVCDYNKTGEINKAELYSGLILVYLKLAKYVGPAACYPPSREVVNELFELSDVDDSGGISQSEFSHIMILLSSQLTWRIATYYIFLIFLVPYVIDWSIAFLCLIGVDDTIWKMDSIFDRFAPFWLQRIVGMIPESTWESLPETIVSVIIFYIAIPFCWDGMDNYFQSVAGTYKASSGTIGDENVTSESEPVTESETKKDE